MYISLTAPTWDDIKLLITICTSSVIRRNERIKNNEEILKNNENGTKKYTKPILWQ